jgi:beta-galactosidase/beta-glucuronidase
MHPEKSKIVYCKDSNRRQDHENVSFTFLGFTFRPRAAKNRQGQLFTGFLPGVSSQALKRMRETIKQWRLPRQTPGTLEELARQSNPVVRGWKNYYGAFYPSALDDLWRYLDQRLESWGRHKYKTLRRHKQRSAEWLGKMKNAYPGMFEHWRVKGQGWMMGAG